MKARTITIKTPEKSDFVNAWTSFRAATSRGLHRLAERAAPGAKPAKKAPRRKKATAKKA